MDHLQQTCIFKALTPYSGECTQLRQRIWSLSQEFNGKNALLAKALIEHSVVSCVVLPTNSSLPEIQNLLSYMSLSKKQGPGDVWFSHYVPFLGS